MQMRYYTNIYWRIITWDMKAPSPNTAYAVRFAHPNSSPFVLGTSHTPGTLYAIGFGALGIKRFKSK
jgi:hypothetical protein